MKARVAIRCTGRGRISKELAGDASASGAWSPPLGSEWCGCRNPNSPTAPASLLTQFSLQRVALWADQSFLQWLVFLLPPTTTRSSAERQGPPSARRRWARGGRPGSRVRPSRPSPHSRGHRVLCPSRCRQVLLCFSWAHPAQTLKAERAADPEEGGREIYHFYGAFQRRRLLGGLGTKAGSGVNGEPQI